MTSRYSHSPVQPPVVVRRGTNFPAPRAPSVRLRRPRATVDRPKRRLSQRVRLFITSRRGAPSCARSNAACPGRAARTCDVVLQRTILLPHHPPLPHGLLLDTSFLARTLLPLLAHGCDRLFELARRSAPLDHSQQQQRWCLCATAYVLYPPLALPVRRVHELLVAEDSPSPGLATRTMRTDWLAPPAWIAQCCFAYLVKPMLIGMLLDTRDTRPGRVSADRQPASAC